MQQRRSQPRGPSQHDKRRADQIDLMLAERIRQRRTEMGLSQLELASRLGISDQQLSKYEGASNRVSAARLYDIARALEVPVGWFYRDERPARLEPSQMGDASEAASVRTDAVITLVRSYASLTCATDRAQLLEIVKTFTRRAR